MQSISSEALVKYFMWIVNLPDKIMKLQKPKLSLVLARFQAFFFPFRHSIWKIVKFHVNQDVLPWIHGNFLVSFSFATFVTIILKKDQTLAHLFQKHVLCIIY